MFSMTFAVGSAGHCTVAPRSFQQAISPRRAMIDMARCLASKAADGGEAEGAGGERSSRRSKIRCAGGGGDSVALALPPPPLPLLPLLLALLAATVDPLSKSDRAKGRGLGGRDDEVGEGRGDGGRDPRGDAGTAPRGERGRGPHGETGLDPGTGVHGREMRTARGLGGAEPGLGLGVPARSRCMCNSCASACFCDGWLRSSRSSASVAGLIRAHTRSATGDR